MSYKARSSSVLLLLGMQYINDVAPDRRTEPEPQNRQQQLKQGMTDRRTTQPAKFFYRKTLRSNIPSDLPRFSDLPNT